ncbi:YjgN family protein [Ramlibacter pallidus]|uniref:DUF898 domain-containing protein n=1 Tax=Ramlibacter pallidus TaxID=2780087 RepID=A0ABR9RY55_9BURK|nr:YjgN family protein [Ramlibacter pallidus]MBE7366149.1 DUF898 domain-containing protein [Ramlibacter pallidus]
MDLETSPAAPVVASHRLRFTGDGGVYFGVWMVNVVLMVVTLGLFTPFARRRTIRYFYQHTDIAGSPLEFTGGIKRMVFGFLLFFGLYAAYSIASHTEQTFAVAALGTLWVVLSPWLWASAVRFRTVSTRWRGIRGEFHAGWRETYAASAPILLFFLLAAAIGFGGSAIAKLKPSPWWILAGAIAAVVATLCLLVRQEYNYARLRVLRTSFGGLQGRWDVEFGQLLKITVLAFGLFVAVIAALLALLFLAVVATGAGLALFGGGRKEGAALALLITVAIFGSLLVFYLASGPALAWREARKFALVWNHTALGDAARFTSDLQAGAFVRLRLKNMALSVLTGGFWRPFAITSEYAMKLQSVTLHVEGGLDQLVGRLAQRQPGGLGDAIADGVGFDVVG